VAKKRRKAARARKGTAKAARPKAAPKARVPPPDVVAGAQQTERETGIPTSVTLGQWALESGYGKHSPGNNPFGIKARKGEPFQLLWTKEKAKNGSGLVRVQQKFRAYDSVGEAFKARADLLSRRYPEAMAHTNDPDKFVHGLQAVPGRSYATDPNYASKVIGVMKANDYYQYDLKNQKAKADPLTQPNNDASLRLMDGEPTVLLGTDRHMAAHVDTPHTGGGKIVEGSPTIFVGPNQRRFARYGDTTDDGYQVVADVQDNVFLG
jgi:hypothetical protein